MQLYNHNLKAYQQMQERFKNSQKTAIIHPTGTGKMYIFLKWLLDNPQKTFLFLAPTSAIMYQLKYAMEENGYHLSDFPNLTCALYCHLLNWDTKDFQVNYDHIVLDEFHRAGSPKWGQAVKYLLESHPNSKVLGLSATPTRYTDHKNMLDTLFEGNIASEITLAEAMAKGILPLPTYISTIYSLNQQFQELEENIKSVTNPAQKLELEKLVEQARESLHQVEGLDQIFARYMTKKDGKYLLFCKDIQHLEEMKTKIKKWFGGINDKIEVYDVHSKHSDVANEQTLNRFRQDKSHTLKLLLSVAMLNEGLHIENIDGVIMLRPTSSHIIYMQQLGRGLSAHNKKPLIIDVVNNIRAYESVYDIQKEIEQYIERHPQKSISQEEFKNQFKIIDNMRDIMNILKTIDDYFRMSNSAKLKILQAYINEGYPYNKIIESTVDKHGYPIGQWIMQWRWGRIKLTEEERNILISMGETFERKYKPALTNQQKLDIIQSYIDSGHPYASIVNSTQDSEENDLGRWIAHWRSGFTPLTIEERKRLISMGETFEKKRAARLNNSQKLKILKAYVEKGNKYDDITRFTKDEQDHPIGVWIANWRSGAISLTEEERMQLMNIGETFEAKKPLRMQLFASMETVENPILERQTPMTMQHKSL